MIRVKDYPSIIDRNLGRNIYLLVCIWFVSTCHFYNTLECHALWRKTTIRHGDVDIAFLDEPR